MAEAGRQCAHCGAPLGASAPGWCDACGRGARLPARELLDWLVADAAELAHPRLDPASEGAPGGLDPASEGVAGGIDPDPLAWPGYAQRRAEVRAATGTDESVVAVVGTIAVRHTGPGSAGAAGGIDPGSAGAAGGVAAVVVAFEFGFFGGSMSSAAGAIIAGAYDEARARRLPVVVLISTGGARMQEGMASLAQLAATTVAATRHADSGLLQVAVLGDPTTGGVFASFANHADVILAEPGATIGFAGPRVAEAMTGGPLPEGSHTARGARAAGLVDAIVARPDLPWVLARMLAWPGDPSRPRADATSQPVGDAGRLQSGPTDAWTEVQRARAPDRARAPAFLDALDVVTELHGDRAGNDDPSVRVALARLGPGAGRGGGREDSGRPIVVVALDRTGRGGRPGPSAYRKAWRGLRLASRLGVALVTLIDTPGADASASAEAGGVAYHIARTFVEVLAARVPVVALVIGEGGSGGALAFAVGDRLLIQEHATFTVIAPEGAAAILHRDTGRAAEVAALLEPTAAGLADLGLADEVVTEPDGGEVAAAWAAVRRHLADLDAQPADALVAARAERWA